MPTDNALVLGNLREYGHNFYDIALKLDALGYISTAESIGVSSTILIRNAPPKATEFGEITQSKSFKIK